MLSVLAVGVLAGCQNGTGTHGRTAATPSAGPVVSAGESARVLDGYVRAYNKAVARPGVKARREPATGALAELVRGNPPSPISLADPVLYVPRSDSYPKWFAATALERRGATEHPVFLLFVQARADGAWLPANRLYLTGDPPKIAIDAQGYAVALAPDTGGLAMRPADVPAAQAAYLDHDDRKIAPGRLATRRKAMERLQNQGLRARGVEVTAHSTPEGDSVYALRTGDGGALVWSAFRRTVTYTTREAAVEVPAGVRRLLGPRTGRRAVATWLWRSVAYVPPRGRPDVLTQALDLISARAS